MKECKMILPKLWLQRIPRYWDAVVPAGYPDTSSEFSLKFTNEEVAVAVKDMEEKLNTEESIITIEMVPEGKRVGTYLGTYDVTGVAGEETLLSPIEVSESDVDVLAFHYNEESAVWEQIEDAHIKDGYVYGTVASFSPISVFTVRRTGYVQAADVSIMKKETFVANGNPITVLPKEDGSEGVVVTCNGEKFELGKDCAIIGGAINESIKSSSVYVEGVEIPILFAGSICTEDEPITIDRAVAEIVNSKITSYVCGTGRKVRVNNVILKAKDSTIYAIGAGRSNQNGVDSNTEDNLTMAAHQWVKYATIELNNCEVEVVYTACFSGMSYNIDTNLIINGGKYHYVAAGGSNGRTEKAVVKANDAEITNLITINRGTVAESKMVITNCVIPELFVFGSNADDITGTVEKVSYDITGGNIKLYAGKNGGVPVTYEEACKVVSALKISRRTEVEYMEEADYLLADIIKIK